MNVLHRRKSIVLLWVLISSNNVCGQLSMPSDLALPESSVNNGTTLPPSQNSYPPPTVSNGPNNGPANRVPPPSLASRPSNSGIPTNKYGNLPRESGQETREYDISPYTGYLTGQQRPQQPVVDWILRETGTDVWFTEPFGFMNARRDALVVHHTPDMHAVVQSVVDRFTAGSKDPQVFSLKILTVGSPNWRSRANPLIQHVNVQSPGVQAWLVTKENTAMLLNLLRSRGDVRELQAVDLVLHNGQSETIGSTRDRNYIRSIRPSIAGWPPYEPETGQAPEGFQLEVSPLLSIDAKTIDVALRCSIDQLEKLVPVDMDLPLPNGQNQRMRIEVPQVVSWRLHERFRWPADQVLLLSCGVIGSPDRSPNPTALLNLDRFVGGATGRADALLILEWKGKAADGMVSVPHTANGTNPSRGRY